MGTGTIFGKFTGATAYNLKDTTPLANINFSSVSTPNVLTHITKIKQFKPFEEIKGVCTSLEEWVLHILQPDQEFQLMELQDNDPETAQHWDRVMEGKKHATFEITTKIFTAAKDNIDVTQKTTISTDLIPMQTDTKDNQTKNQR